MVKGWTQEPLLIVSGSVSGMPCNMVIYQKKALFGQMKHEEEGGKGRFWGVCLRIGGGHDTSRTIQHDKKWYQILSVVGGSVMLRRC